MTNSGYSRVFFLVVGLVGLAGVTTAQEEDMGGSAPRLRYAQRD